MAINVPMPDLPGKSFLQGMDSGSSMWSRIMQPAIERERMQQQQQQFVQNLALQKQAQGRAQALLPLMIQQYQDTHKTAVSEQQFKDMYRNLLRDAMNPDNGNGGQPSPSTPLMQPQAGGGQQGGGYTPTPQEQQQISQMQPGDAVTVGGGVPAVAPPMPGTPGAPPMNAMPGNTPNPMPTGMGASPIGSDNQEHELRSGNPRLAKLDTIAGLVPGIPKPVQHISGGMVFTTYPSGRMTVQKVGGMQSQGAQTVTAKEGSKIRDQATALINSANLVNQGYELLDNNPDLTGIGSGAADYFNLSNNPQLGTFNTVTGKLQAELGKYASSRGGIQAVKWAGSVKPSQWKPEEYNYGMFEGIERNLKDDYATLNAQYKAATGEDLPVPLPKITRKEKSAKGSTSTESGDNKVTKKWKLVNGELV